MADFKVSYVFRSPNGGWTENFYDEATSIDEFGPLTIGELNAVLHFRGTGVVLQAKKVVEEGGLRRGKIIPVNEESNHGGTAAPKDVAGVTAKLRLNFEGGGGRTLNVRGLADVDVEPSSSQNSKPSSYLLGRLNYYITWIKGASNPYHGKVLVDSGSGGEPWANVISLSADPTNSAWTRVTMEENLSPPVAGNLVYFRGVDLTILPYLTGYFRVVGEITDEHFSIPTLYREASPTTTLRNVQWRKALYEYPAIVSGAFQRFGTRDTAGPFRESRGSRPARKLRQ